MNEQVAQAVDNFINSPVGSIIVGVIGVLLIALVIFSKTSLGKKLFSKAQNDIRQINEIARLSNEKVEQVKILAEERINSLKSEYERKSAILVSYNDLYEQEFSKIIENIPNAKVQHALTDFHEKLDEKKKEIADVFPTYEEFMILKDKAREIEEQVNEKVAEIKSTYEDTLIKLQKKLQELEAKLNEREVDTKQEI